MRDFTWAQVMDEARSMAAHLQSLGLPAGSRVAILSKNSAHWLIADLAIWMAGHVSVPLYPSSLPRRSADPRSRRGQAPLRRQARWLGQHAGRHPRGAPLRRVAAGAGHDCVQWDEIVAATSRSRTTRSAPATSLDDHLHLRHHRQTEGRHAQLRDLRCAPASAPRRRITRAHALLPPAGPRRRTLAGRDASLAIGMRVFFAESLETFAADLRRPGRPSSSACRASGSSSSRRSREDAAGRAQRCWIPIGAASPKKMLASSRPRRVASLSPVGADPARIPALVRALGLRSSRSTA